MVSSREANQNFSRLTRAAREGPVVITDRGRKAFVLMTNEEYERIARPRKSLADMLSQDGPEADFPFDPPKMGPIHFKIPDFSE